MSNKKSRRTDILELNFAPEDVIPYNSINCLDVLCSSNDILSRFKYDSRIMFKNLRQGNLNIIETLPVDDNCLCDMGNGKRPFVNKFTCIGCELIRRLCGDVKIHSSGIISIETGKYVGKKLKVNSYKPCTFSNYEKSDELYKILRLLSYKENSKYLLDDTYYRIYKNTEMFITNNSINTHILASIFVNEKLRKYKIPQMMPFEWAFECNNKTNLIEVDTLSFKDMSNIERFQKNFKLPTAQTKVNSLNQNAMIGILKQLISLLHFMTKYSLIHGYPSIEFIRFIDKPCQYKYNEVNVESPVCLLLKPSYNVSFSIETDDKKYIRLVSRNAIVNIEEIISYPIENMNVIINHRKKNVGANNEIPILPEIEDHIIYTYKIGKRINEFITYVNLIGIPLLNSSFEFYCFMIALLSEHSFRTTFLENENLQNLWYSLWKPSEYDMVMEDINKLTTYEQVVNEDIVKVVSKYHLRIDGLKHFWEYVSLL